MNLNNYFVVSDKNKKSYLLKKKVLKFIKPVSLSKSNIIIVNSCGDSLKDKDIIKKKLGKYIR